MQVNVWQFDKAGAPLVRSSARLAAPGAGKITVRNEAIGINPVDWKFIESNPLNWQQGHIPGVDGAGVVVAVGEGVEERWLGKRVAYHHSLMQQGSFADHTQVYANRVMTLPEGFDFALAAALPCPMLTAWQAFSKVPVRSGAKVLVNGMGAVNKLLVQMLAQAGFIVHVVSSSLTQQQAKAIKVERIYRTEPSEGRFYAVFDANGSDAAKRLVPLIEANGHMVCILGRIDTPIDAPFTRTISYHEVALGALHDFGDYAQWQRLIQDGERFLAQISHQDVVVEAPHSFAFNDVNEALDFSKTEKRKAIVDLTDGAE
ncbi:alcohol dehydrogenase catalytic domain-containing protein [Marinomonas pollencensis]|uniref:NADPH:quinone reductase-like Zn-dependent oxidoreductase n=1 Tax=Marinomonas pollencensis TaxID=491954 RepID=A0A3E0DR77_9GAMM|nr:alcohol dehydrogenase catalytic domain-containing protein [Marinomonas pollencensis]REG85635.1 NADPH:quinone reductase-like Zn-dependent oxidoreductase [Marinomonas pollencensis]